MPGIRSRPVSSPIILLALSLAILLATGYQAYRVSRLHRRTAQQLLHDYAAFAAWSYQRHLTEELLEVAWLTLNPIRHRELHESQQVPGPEKLIGYREESLRTCRCDPEAKPSTYFSFLLGTDSLATAGNPLAPAEGGAVLSRITTLLRAPGDVPATPTRILGPSPEFPALIAYGLMPTIRLDTVVYGFTFEPSSLPATFRAILAGGDLLPVAVSRGKPNVDLLSIEVRDSAGHLMYRDSAWTDAGQVAQEQLPARVAGLVVRTTVRPEAASALVDGGLPRLPLGILLALVTLAFALAVVALLQLRREGELNRLRTDFVASVSHELRTPLAQIRLFLDTLRLKRYSTDEQRDWLLGHLVRETTRLEHLVDNVLRFSAADRTGGGPLALESVPLAEEIRETLSTFAPLAASRRASLTADLADGLVARLDRARFRQLLLNLLDNAVKFGPPGQQVRVELRQAGGTAQLRVTDQGPGIPEVDRSRIWEPYFRGRSAQTRAVGGSGIGLAIVRDTAARMGGRVWFESAPGGGACFVAELPLQQSGTPSPPAGAPAVTAASQ